MWRPTDWKRPWCWERLRAKGEGGGRGWDGGMASPTQWTWVWVNSGSWWQTRRPGVLQSMGSQRVGHDWATELNWKSDFTDYFTFVQWMPHKYLLMVFSTWETRAQLAILELKRTWGPRPSLISRRPSLPSILGNVLGKNKRRCSCVMLPTYDFGQDIMRWFLQCIWHDA